MPQRVKPVTRLVGGSLSASMTGVGVVGVTAQEVTGAGAHAVSVGVASSGSGSAVIPGAAYTLATATAGLPFVVNTPAPPNGTLTEVTVTPATIGSHIGVNGRRLTLSAVDGAYGSLNFGAQDQEIIVGAGAVIQSVQFTGTARRIIFRAEVARDMTITDVIGTANIFSTATTADILIDGANCLGDLGEDRCYVNAQRLAIINSRLRTFAHAVYCGTSSPNDMIFGNCEFVIFGSTQSGPRFQSANRLVMVDCRITKTLGISHSLRIHCDNWSGAQSVEHAYIARNQIGDRLNVSIIPDGTGSGTTATIGQVWFEDNNVYGEGSFSGSMISVDSAANTISAIYARRNNWYGPGTAVFGNPNAAAWVGPLWVNENNNTASGYVTPPAWEFA